MQGVREVPDINVKSIQIIEKRQRDGEHDPQVHQRLYAHTLVKDELARKTEMDEEEERVRKQEFMLRNFSDHR